MVVSAFGAVCQTEECWNAGPDDIVAAYAPKVVEVRGTEPLFLII